MTDDHLDSVDTTKKSSLLKQSFVCALLAILVGAICLGGFLIFQWLWMLDGDGPPPEILGRVWMTLSSLAVGAVAGAWVIRWLHGMPLPTVHGAEIMALRINEQRIRLASYWFIAMRWLAAIGVGVMIFLVVEVFGLLPHEVIVPLGASVVILVVSNLCYLLLIRSFGTSRRLLLLQAFLDLILLTLLLHFSGGIENPLAIAVFFHVLIGGILLSRRECFVLVGVATLLLGALGVSEALGWITHYTLDFVPHAGAHSHAPHSLTFVALTVGLYAFVLVITAHFVTSLSGSLRRNEIRLSEIAEEATEARHLLLQALETTSTGLRVLRADLIPFWSNSLWEGWFGSEHEECSIFNDREEDRCPARDCLQHGAIRRTEVSDPSGSGRTFRITTAPVHDAEGQVIRIVQLAEDVTEEKQAYQRMMHAGRMAAVGELAGKVAHEVNNPVGIISAKANLLLSDRQEEMSEKVADEVIKMRNLSDRIGRIAQGLLSYSRPSSGHQNQMDLRAPVRVSFAFVRQQGVKQGIEFIDELGDHQIPVRANAAEIEQVFLNLFLNAIQAMPDGGKLRIIRLPESAGHRDEAADWVGVAVEDSGSGIDVAVRDQIFQPFFTTKAEQRGTGLGLSVCHGLVQSHGGRIEVANSSLGGARFNVWLRRRESRSS